FYGGGVAVRDPVVLRLGPARVAGEAALLAERVEVRRPAGDDLVHVGLVAGVPQDDVPGRVEHPVQGQRELDRTEVRPQVPAAGSGHGVDDELPDLGGELRQLVVRQLAEVGRARDGREDRQGAQRYLWQHPRSTYGGPPLRSVASGYRAPVIDVEEVADVLAYQATACRIVGSSLYERILLGALADVRAGGVCARVLDDHHVDPYGSALALRFLGAVHRIALEGRAPALAALYPSTGGDPSAGDPVAAFLAMVADHEDEVRHRLADGLQTNEVGRSAALVGGYAEVARRTGLPLRVLELGASAGLNLRFDRYCYDTGRHVLGNPASPLRFADVWDPAPDLSGPVAVAERRGCDRNPLDPTSEDDRLTLASYVWPDQVVRLARLRTALELAAEVPVEVDHADAADWTAAQLA